MEIAEVLSAFMIVFNLRLAIIHEGKRGMDFFWIIMWFLMPTIAKIISNMI